MTNEQKIKAYLDAGHYVKVNLDNIWWYVTIVNYDIGKFIYSDWSSDLCFKFEYDTIEPLPLTPPPYKEWDKVIILDVAKQVANYSEWDQKKKDMIWKVFTIDDVIFCIDIWEYSFPYWAVAPYFDDKEEEKQTKIQELETQLATIAKELELLKK
mgnify:FL=1